MNTVPENESASDQTRLWSKQFDRKDAERDFRAARLALAIVYRRACGEKGGKERERGGDNGRHESEVHNSPQIKAKKRRQTYTGTPAGGSHKQSPEMTLAYIFFCDSGSRISTLSARVIEKQREARCECECEWDCSDPHTPPNRPRSWGHISKKKRQILHHKLIRESAESSAASLRETQAKQ